MHPDKKMKWWRRKKESEGKGEDYGPCGVKCPTEMEKKSRTGRPCGGAPVVHRCAPAPVDQKPVATVKNKL